jgi:DNA-binding CsgD family transcriptional regulator
MATSSRVPPRLDSNVSVFPPIRELGLRSSVREGVRKKEVCAAVTEVTQRKELEFSLVDLSCTMLCADTALRAYINAYFRINHSQTKKTKRLVQLAKLVNSCVSEFLKISQSPYAPLRQISPDILSEDGCFTTSSVSDCLQCRGGRVAISLSMREREILSILAQGKSNKEAAGALGISVRTVETHRARIMFKLGLHSISELVLFAVRNKIVDPSKCD